MAYIICEPCIGTKDTACVDVCPVDCIHPRKDEPEFAAAEMLYIHPDECIDCGACVPACPVEAITLVFGTEKRGIDIPHVSPEFETNVNGIYIAGELGGMGLIRKAAEQGRQAMDAIRRRANGSHDLDVLIVGCGPAGLSAGLAAIHHKLRYRLIEQEDSLGGAVYHYPRNKIAMTAPVQLALVGKVKFGEVSKEQLLEFWQDVVQRTGLQVSFRERLVGIERSGDGFVVQTERGTFSARSVLLAMGRRGTPRKLDVPGEEASKVVYRLVDAQQYRGMHVLVVGGGDSALEAAIALAEQPGTTVTLSYRSAAFARVKAKNRERLEALRQTGGLNVLMSSKVTGIEQRRVNIEHEGRLHALPNEAVIVCAGGELPTPLLQKFGIRFETKFGTH